MNNSYKIITGKATFDELVVDKEVWIAHDHSKDLSQIDWDLIIDYFIGTEEYLKCRDLDIFSILHIYNHCMKK